MLRYTTRNISVYVTIIAITIFFKNIVCFSNQILDFFFLTLTVTKDLKGTFKKLILLRVKCNETMRSGENGCHPYTTSVEVSDYCVRYYNYIRFTVQIFVHFKQFSDIFLWQGKKFNKKYNYIILITNVINQYLAPYR